MGYLDKDGLSRAFTKLKTLIDKKQDKMKTTIIPSSTRTNKNKWIKFATIDLSSAGAWKACSGTLSFCMDEGYSTLGLLKFQLRNGGTADAVGSNSLIWVSLSDNNYATSVADVKVSNGKYDIYYKPIKDYETPYVSLIDCLYPDAFTFNTGSYVESITAATTSSVRSYANVAGSANAVAWGNVSGKPSTFAPSAHSHNDLYYTETEMDSKLSGKANSSHTHTKSQITDFAHTHDDRYYTKSEIDTKLSGKAASSHKHAAADITSVNASAITGTIAAANLPSYVDDVLEYDGTSKFPSTGEAGKIYTDTTTNKIYRWGGSSYVVISDTIALGETSSTAYRGDRGKIAYDHSQITRGNPHKVTKSDVGLGSVDNTSDANKSVKYAKSATANNPIKTTGTGAAYVATVDGITALTIGAKFTMVPHTVSTTTAPTLNVSGLGAKNIRMRLTSSTADTIQLTRASFLTANKPVNVVYDGSYWVIDDFAQPDVKADITIGTAEPTSSTSGIFYIQTT